MVDYTLFEFSLYCILYKITMLTLVVPLSLIPTKILSYPSKLPNAVAFVPSLSLSWLFLGNETVPKREREAIIYCYY